MTASTLGADAYGLSAGLDLVSGVFGYLAAQQNASLAQSRADLIRTEAEANAQRYAEQAAQQQAHEEVMYLASGVKLSGSPVDALATSARIASENEMAILMGGDAKAEDEQVAGVNAEIQGRDALIGGIDRSVGAAAKGVSLTLPAGSDQTNLGIISTLMSGTGRQ